MRAVILNGIKDGIPDMTFGELPMPEPRPGEVLIRLESAPINPSDLAFIKGVYGRGGVYPIVPGFEGSGTVMSNGGGLLGWRLIGKRVAVVSQPGKNGTWAEYMVADAKTCVVLGNQVTFNQGACFFVNPLTVLAMSELISTGKHRAVVHTAAASSLGKMLLRHCQNNRITLINVVRRPEQVAALKDLGAEYVLNSTDEEFDVQLKDLCNQLNATIAFECVAGEMTGRIFNAMCKKSTVYLYGSLSLEGANGIKPSGFIFDEKTVKGLWLTEWIKSKNVLQLMNLMRKVGNMLVNELSTVVSQEYPIQGFQEAIEFYKQNMSSGKVIFKPQGNN